MPRIKEVEIDGFLFTNIEGLFWHSGDFWMNNKIVPVVENNGSRSILLNGNSKRGLKKLRKFARPCKIKIYTEKLPF